MAGPTIRRKQLGIELRKLRETVPLTRAQAAAAIKCSESRIAQIELGRNVVSYSELILLLRDHYDAGQETLDALEELRQEAAKRGWWSTYGLPDWLAGYVGLEHDASSVRTVELELIPGLLQTEEYARAVNLLTGRLSGKQVEQRTAARLQRQERLVGTDRMQLTALVSEGALLRCARQPSIGAEQLAMLTDRARWPNIELRVIPFCAGLHAGAAGAFSLLSFPDRLLPDAAHQEYAVGGHIVDDESVVSELARLFDKLRCQALGATESLAVIAELAQHIHE